MSIGDLVEAHVVEAEMLGVSEKEVCCVVGADEVEAGDQMAGAPPWLHGAHFDEEIVMRSWSERVALALL